MVGVPGRSGGCTTCRRRKVKCGAEKPSCKRCVSSGRQCEGYAKYAVFINNTPTGRLKRARFEEVRPIEVSSGPSSPISQASPIYQGVDDFDHIEDGNDFVTSGWLIPAPVDSQALVTAGMIGRSIGQYMPALPMDRVMLGNHWLDLAASQAMPGSPLELSISALAWSRAGWHMQDEALTAQGRILYGQALTVVNSSLRDPAARLEDQLLATCRALGLYELYESKSADVNGFHQHTVGLCKLVQLRGVDRHTSSLAKAMLLDTRWSAMIFSLTMRQDSFLAHDEWTAPFTQDESMEPDLELARIGLSLGGLLARLDVFQQLPTSVRQQSSLDQVARDLNGLYYQLLDWEVKFSATVVGALFTVLDTDTGDLVDPSTPSIPWPLNHELSFPSLRTATLLIRSWSIRPILLAALLSLPTRVSLQPSSLGLEATYIATLITRSASFMTLPVHGLMASQNYILPLRVAMFVLMRGASRDATLKDERDRCLDAYRNLSVGKGLSWAKTIGNTGGSQETHGEDLDIPRYGGKHDS